MRAIWNMAGFMLLGIGMFGVFTPGFPGTGFLVLSLFCFTKGGNAKWRAWLLSHPKFGKILGDFERDQSLPLWVKWVSGVCIVFFTGLSVWMVEAMWVKGVLVALAVIGVWYIASRKVSGRGELMVSDSDTLDLAS